MPSVRRHWQDLGYLILYITGRPDMQKQRVVSWLCQHNFPQGMIFFSDGLVHDPLRQKAIFLRNLVQECFIRISAAYGSTKDISVYSVLGLLPSQIFIVGRPTKKYQAQCQVGAPGRVGAAWAGSAVHSVVFVHSFICPLTHLFIRSLAVSTCTMGIGPGPGPGAVGCPIIQAAVPVARGLMDDGGHGVVTPPPRGGTETMGARLLWGVRGNCPGGLRWEEHL
ncbi:membrane-associated phosphatidylinositol transfer protein 3-like [Herpailurus yagouaroundi]|uniref:membrane-associated phosphatidylinositol transfer protein 3-like n=1 Tax=Herpailurus yagouaroundi TaxID=1608482 RepID=UPI001AD72A99|nr:membrane-associated phosphatidylinositol transfer protein 3-like [Puma yagouaroundi]